MEFTVLINIHFLHFATISSILTFSGCHYRVPFRDNPRLCNNKSDNKYTQTYRDRAGPRELAHGMLQAEV